MVRCYRNEQTFEKVEKISSKGIGCFVIANKVKKCTFGKPRDFHSIVVFLLFGTATFTSSDIHYFAIPVCFHLSYSVLFFPLLCLRFRFNVSRWLCRQSKLIFYFPFGEFISRSQRYRSFVSLFLFHFPFLFRFLNAIWATKPLCRKGICVSVLDSLVSFANMFALTVLAFIEVHFEFVRFKIFEAK